MCHDARFTRTAATEQIFFVTRSAMELVGQSITSSYREYTHPRDEIRSYTKEATSDNTKIGPVLEVLVTKHYDRHEIEVKN